MIKALQSVLTPRTNTSGECLRALTRFFIAVSFTVKRAPHIQLVAFLKQEYNRFFKLGQKVNELPVCFLSKRIYFILIYCLIPCITCSLNLSIRFWGQHASPLEMWNCTNAKRLNPHFRCFNHITLFPPFVSNPSCWRLHEEDLQTCSWRINVCSVILVAYAMISWDLWCAKLGRGDVSCRGQ